MPLSKSWKDSSISVSGLRVSRIEHHYVFHLGSSRSLGVWNIGESLESHRVHRLRQLLQGSVTNAQ